MGTLTQQWDILDAIDSGDDEGTLPDGRPYWYSLNEGVFWIYAEDEQEFGDNTVERWKIDLSVWKED